MSARRLDDVILETRRHMLAAAARLDQAAKDLRAARRTIEAHPDWKRWGDNRGTLAAWMHDCLMSASNEAPVSAGGGWIRESVVRFRADYKRHVNEQRRDLERFARDAQREAARFQREAATFSISFTPSGSNALTLTLAWADKTWSVDLSGAR